MGNYLIEELIEYHCDNSGVLTVTFRIEGDPDNTCRFLETDEYYYYAEETTKENDIFNSEWENDDNDDTYNDIDDIYDRFDFKEWKNYEHSEEKVKEFIYEHYVNKNELPDLEEK